jgi:hypothetical protein
MQPKDARHERGARAVIVKLKYLILSQWMFFLLNATSVINLHTFFSQWYKNKANQ